MTNSSQGGYRASTREPLLRPSDVWSVKELEPWQSNGLKWRILDVIDRKKRKLENYGKKCKFD
jgi:hypothetical protein